MRHHIQSDYRQSQVIDVTPENAGWKYLSYRVVNLKAGQHFTHETDRNEAAFVPLAGSGQFMTAGKQFPVSRKGVFHQLPHVLYAPPKHTIQIEAVTDFEFAVGSAPAEGKYPLRLFTPQEMKTEVRGGGAATRQVNHLLAHPLPAERLILFEVLVPGGMWSGYPPHCHDGYHGAPYLEETYHFRLNPEDGFAFHRNYRVDQDFDEVFTVANNDLVLVTQGFHSTVAAPGVNVYFLNYLAGDLLDAARATPSYDDPRYASIKQDWAQNQLPLPVMYDND